jgi:hypothetical protein
MTASPRVCAQEIPPAFPWASRRTDTMLQLRALGVEMREQGHATGSRVCFVGRRDAGSAAVQAARALTDVRAACRLAARGVTRGLSLLRVTLWLGGGCRGRVCEMRFPWLQGGHRCAGRHPAALSCAPSSSSHVLHQLMKGMFRDAAAPTPEFWHPTASKKVRALCPPTPNPWCKQCPRRHGPFTAVFARAKLPQPCKYPANPVFHTLTLPRLPMALGRALALCLWRKAAQSS